jgi:REase_DpnII-MboI
VVPVSTTLTSSLGSQVGRLDALIRGEEEPALSTPAGSFARHVYEAVDERGPIPDWDTPAPAVGLRGGVAPALASFDFRIASARTSCSPEHLSAWEAGLRRLSQRDPFTADRQTFAFRPLEVFGIALGASRHPALSHDLRSWLRGVLERLERDAGPDDWARCLSETAAQLLGLAWREPGARPQGTIGLDELALRRWVLRAHPAPPTGAPTGDPMEIEAELLRRALTEDLGAPDVARAAVLHQAIRRATSERLASDLAESWQIGRETVDATRIVTNLCRRFHLFAKQIQKRHSGRSTLEFKDEYDVQDALHSVLQLHFDDVRAEEYTPSYGGSSTRMDFLLKREQVVIEAKMTRKGLDQKEVANQLIEDKERYRAHPECRTLVCFVYDPGSYLANPTSLEDDLSSADDELRVVVVVCPKGT